MPARTPCRVVRAVSDARCNGGGWRWPPGAWHTFPLSGGCQPGHKVFVTDGVSELCATCALTIIPSLARAGRGYAVIENVVTHPQHRKRGLGSAVLAAAVQAAWAANCYKVSLATGSQRESTLRFYEKAGFKRNARTFFEQRRA